MTYTQKVSADADHDEADNVVWVSNYIIAAAHGKWKEVPEQENTVSSNAAGDWDGGCAGCWVSVCCDDSDDSS